jgi:hypothetical protein
MQHNSINNLRSVIEERAREYHAIKGAEDEWEFETIEQDVIHRIFRYMASTGLTINGCDLQKILDAEDDEDEGVPPEGVDATLMNLMLAIHPADRKENQYTPDIVELWDVFYRAFWPHYFED